MAGNASRPLSKLYDLDITIVSAKHLKNVNWRHGDLKPYAILWVDPERRQATKSDDSGSKQPVWNERFVLPLTLPPQDSLLILEIFHSKPSETPKPLVGTLRFQLKDLVDSDDSTKLRTFELRRPSGRPQDEKCEGVGSSEEDQDNSGGETELPEIDPRAEDRELKNHLLRKYSGYLSSLKQELSKKKKKGKLPKEARQKLLSWWELHYKWPYPSETEKVALAESTGLDQKQINNWFINQRKRHWKPSEDMQFMVMDGLHPQNTALYMEGNYMGEGLYRLGP